MQTLLRDYPRDAWPGHPNFAASIANWMGAHQMFRKLSALTNEATEKYMEKEMEAEDFVARLAWYGDALVRNLHGHHGWEDRSFFPELQKADTRFSDGLEILESDHVALDALLDDFTHSANRLIKLHQLEPAKVNGELGGVYGAGQKIGAFLDRHLSDEEDLAVPILLHHKLRG